MKQLAAFSISAIFLLNVAFGQTTKTKDGDMKVKEKGSMTKVKDKSGNGMMPYMATYSSNFRIGNPAYARMVLDLWKDYDDNMFDRHSGWFADTMRMEMPDGKVVKGKEDNMAGVKKYRGSMSSAVSSIQAYIPLHSIDRNEDWVAIWGTEKDTYADGHSEDVAIQEIWQINKDGKVVFIKQYVSKAMPQ